jgi:O-antigen/teichoic acid export membrane protein
VRYTAKVSTAMAIVAVGACAVLVPRFGIVGVPLGQLAGSALGIPWLLRGIGRGTPMRVLRAALPAAAPIVASIALGSAFVARAPLAPAVRGLVAAAVMAVAYAAVAWATGPGWLRAGVREEIARPVRRLSRGG